MVSGKHIGKWIDRSRTAADTGGWYEFGNGLRKAGPKALDVYSDWKTVYINYGRDAA